MDTSMRIPLILTTAALLTGCYSEQGINHVDLKGTVRIPKEAARVQMSDGDDVWEIEPSIKSLGPVYIGVFSGMDDTLEDYSHPEIGPVIDNQVNTYPYGGTTVGRFDWACYQAISCQVVTGRFRDYDEIIEFFRDEVRNPITNLEGNEVTSALEFRERCYEVLYLTGDYELPFISGDDLDFREEGDEFVADIEILHTDYREGVAVWGWMDKPGFNFNFGSCNEGIGVSPFYYELDNDFFAGASFQNLLGYPAQFIEPGDYVAEEAAIIDNPEKEFTLTLGFENGE